MATDELARVSRKLRQSPVADDDGTHLSHDRYTEQIKVLPPSLRDEVNSLMEEIRSAIPSDFTFFVSCEFNGIRLCVDYEDGNTGCFGEMGGGGFHTSRKSMLKRLRATNWDELRADAMKQMDAFDEMVNAAEDRPANIPSSEEAAAKYATELQFAFHEIRKEAPVPAYSLVVVREDSDVEFENLDTRDGLVGTIGDCMTTGYDILAVLEQGVRWAFPEIEAVKREAVEGLGPISRAKAERRF